MGKSVIIGGPHPPRTPPNRDQILIALISLLFLTVVGLLLFITLMGVGGRSSFGTPPNKSPDSPVISWVIEPNPEVLTEEDRGTTPYEDCGSDNADLTLLQVDPCGAEDVCTFKRGGNQTIRLQFTSKVNSPSVRVVVHGIINRVPIPFHIPEPDGCQNSGLACPLVEGGNYTYETTLPVLKTYPAIGVTVKWELVDSEKSPIICALIPVKIE